MSYEDFDDDHASLKDRDGNRHDADDHGVTLNDVEMEPTRKAQAAGGAPAGDATAINVQNGPSDDSNATPAAPRKSTSSTFPRAVSSYRAEIFEDHQWEDVRPGTVPTFSLKNQKKEAAIVGILLIAGLVCVSVGLYKASVHDEESAAALTLVGAIVLLPGIYYTVQLWRAWRSNTEFRIWR